jgi:aspartyl-tRNA(Asn)/glutamyl-tRNA(Gln) amidotransferase subunit A
MMRTLLEAREAVARGEVTPAQLVEEALAAGRRHAELNAIAHLASPEQIEAALRQAPRGPLFGLPITIKDLYVVDGMPTRAGTRAALPELGPQGTAVTRLVQAGAIVVAKTNMHEIAGGVSGENPWTGDVCNPHDPSRQAGGSSSGSGVAVACGIGLASLGSDTGGSIRIPAALCGVVGLKPTYGLIPLDGALPLSWSCDHAGPLACSVDDAHCLIEVLADRSVLRIPSAGGAPARLGVPRRYIDGWLTAPLRRAFEHLLSRLGGWGVKLEDVNAPSLEQSLAIYGALRGAESAFVHRTALMREPEHFSAPVRERLQEGLALPAQAYLEAQRLQRTLRTELDASLRAVDAWILPTVPVPAPRRGAEQVEIERGLTDLRAALVRFTLPFNLAGVPALALPVGRIDGLPISLQIVGARDADARVLAIGRWLEHHWAADGNGR